MTRLLAPAALVALIFALEGTAAAQSKCAAGEALAAGKKIAAKAACWKKATKKGLAIDGACLSTAETKFLAAYAKAEGKGDCVTAVGAATVEGQVDALITDLVTAINGGTGTPAASKCSAKAILEAGKKSLGLLKCVSKAARKGLPIDPDCTAKAVAKFTDGFAKATAAGDCLTSVTVDAAELAVDAGVGAVRLSVQPIFAVALQGANEVPANASPGTGMALVTVDVPGHLLTVEATFADLVAPVTAAHIHCCAPAGVNAGVATMVPFFTGFPAGVTAGTYMAHSFDLTLASSFNAAFVASQGGIAGAEAALIGGIASGRAYFNIHTSVFPGGEIRGQL